MEAVRIGLYILAVVTLRTFTLVKPICLGQIHQKSPKINWSRVLFYLGKKFWEGHTTDIGSQGFHAQLNFFGAYILESKMRRDLADQRDVSFFYLAVISYANSTCEVKQAKM